ncbi:hypothetical protein TCAL_11860 [Tigriopus californicus]|uniref:Protein kinase domain-containing protein n=1 Tax=Tigriopus californicus TaxID=6832 RepID=A0A553PI94_TIGCA|nr:vascular endothelial growth factor receptor 3-like [Tigriopus californicus]TRY77398.1 hypothetical protein TCAL_11860 [Tigriopus californicus]|eukprot:TCALIF_11860-PA protein Name:"Similar to KDR Vascular endothelial growth factor receptor 2 (Coturnix coturnix japonica)" AED:0.56 eAED:0.56 QI:0/-1/0/1/-1/1/1/0/870
MAKFSQCASTLCLVIGVFVHSCRSSDPSEFLTVCNSNLGSLSVAPKSGVALIVGQESDNPTLFITYNDILEFQCESKARNQEVKIIHNELDKRNVILVNVTDFSRHEVSTKIHVNDLTTQGPWNYRNSSIECQTRALGIQSICSTTVLVVRGSDPESCSFNRTLDCNIHPIVTELFASRGMGRINASPFNSVVRYSFYNQSRDAWIECEKVNQNGTNVLENVVDETAVHNIKCPIQVSKPRPVIIRIEKVTNTALGVGTPIFGPPPKSQYSYFSLVVDSFMLSQALDKDDGGDRTMAFIGIALSVVLLAVLAVLAYMCYRNKFAREKISKTSIYSSMVPLKSSQSQGSYVTSDAASMRTETTTDYEKLMNIFNDPMFSEHFFQEITPNEDDNNEKEKPFHAMDKSKLRNILRKQLSGDPSKINPHLSLNQQVNALSYDPKLEIDRENFKIGQLLGSGNFGSVYVGEACGLLHPGSLDTVAIKTVADLLDVSQFSSLMGEMKILTNLDLHLNLVNLLGSCTSLIDQGELWLLIEYCPYGDLKTFIIKNRAQFNNNITGLVSTDFEVRMFLKWAHHIAKGMEYLSSKKIMHGDLAARNILLDDQLIAKVSDFGLSKSMYDSVRYKKEKRHYVPWKWMALEFLCDACFTLKSDVWSYGVLLWEIFSLGQEPYLSQEMDVVIQSIKTGQRLPFPSEVQSLQWAKRIYDTVMVPSWIADPNARISFSEIVSLFESEMFVDELDSYHKLVGEYESVKELLFNHETLSKRNTLSRESSDAVEGHAGLTKIPSDAYHRLFSVEEDASNPNTQTNGYVTVTQVKAKSRNNTDSSTQSTEDVKSRASSDQGYVSHSEMKDRKTSTASSNYVPIQALRRGQ